MAEKKGSDQLFAVKTIIKKKTVQNGDVKHVFTEKRVLASASAHPFLTALHSAFQTAVTVWHKPPSFVHVTLEKFENGVRC